MELPVRQYIEISTRIKVCVRQVLYESYGSSQVLGMIHSEVNCIQPNYATQGACHPTTKLCLMSGEMPIINTYSKHPMEPSGSRQILQELFSA